MPHERVEGRVERVLFTEQAIRDRVAGLVTEIEADLDDGDLVIVALLKGSVVFLSDLIRAFDRPVAFDFVGVASYGDATAPAEALTFTKELSIDIAGRDVLLVDDILDTGRTMCRVIAYLRSFRPASLRVCVLVDKRARRQAPIEPDYRGFEIADEFVVGYGMDFADQFRNLPYVGILAQDG
jgi:hypoxanthine phosphoribosyltransferase